MTEFEEWEADIAGVPAARIAAVRRWLNAAYDDEGRPREKWLCPREALRKFMHTDLRRAPVVWSQPDLTDKLGSCGIYAMATNDEWLYVGFAGSLAMRRNNHSTTLRNASHPNAPLQREWFHTRDSFWFFVLEFLDDSHQRGRMRGEHALELEWKRRLRPICDREARRSDVSFLIQPVNGAPSSMWTGGPPTVPRSTSNVCGLPS